MSIATVVLGRTLSDAILLSVRPAINVANFFIYSSIALMAVSVIYFRLLRAVNAAKLNAGFLLLFAAGTLVFESCKTTNPWFVHAYATFLITAPALGNIIVWNAIGDAFNPRQGRRLFHIVCASSTCGGIIAGFLIPPMLKWLGFSSLPVSYSMIFALATIPVVILHRNRRSERTIMTVAKEKSNHFLHELMAGANDFFSSPLIRNLSIVFFLTAVTTNIIDFSLKYYLQTNFDQNGIATFYGHFNAISNTFNLIVQLTLLSSFLTRFRTRTLFAVTPIVLLVFACPFVFIYSAVCVVLMRFMDVALRFVIQDAAREIALSPLPRLLRNRAKVIFKGVMNPLGGIFAGIVLNVLAPVLGAQYLPLLILPVSATSLFCVRNLNRYCANHLFTALQNNAAKEGILGNEIEHEESEELPEFDAPEQLVDADENVRMAALDVALTLKSHDEELVATPDIRRYVTLLLARELRLAQAILICQNEAVQNETAPVEDLYDAYQEAIQRLFKGLMILYKIEIIETVYQSLASSKSSTRAQALELLQLTISNTSSAYVKNILVMCDDFELAEKCSRLNDLERMLPDEALDVLRVEESRRCRRLVSKLVKQSTSSTEMEAVTTNECS